MLSNYIPKHATSFSYQSRQLQQNKPFIIIINLQFFVHLTMTLIALHNLFPIILIKYSSDTIGGLPYLIWYDPTSKNMAHNLILDFSFFFFFNIRLLARRHKTIEESKIKIWVREQLHLLLEFKMNIIMK
jgi:hypothetical protein